MGPNTPSIRFHARGLRGMGLGPEPELEVHPLTEAGELIPSRRCRCVGLSGGTNVLLPPLPAA